MNSTTEQWLRQQRQTNPDIKPDELASQLADDLTTDHDIATADLAGYLTQTGIYGPYIMFQSAGVLGADGKPLLPFPPELTPFIPAFANIQAIIVGLRGDKDRAGYIQTTNLIVATQMAQMIGGFRQAGLLGDDDSQENGFYALGGGMKYSKPSPDEITTLFAADDLDTARRALVNRCVDGLNQLQALINGSDKVPDNPTLVKLFQEALG